MYICLSESMCEAVCGFLDMDICLYVCTYVHAVHVDSVCLLSTCMGCVGSAHAYSGSWLARIPQCSEVLRVRSMNIRSILHLQLVYRDCSC
jgi:hypothetical protein